VWIRRQFRHDWKLASQREPIGLFVWHPDQLAPRHIGGKRENPTPDVNRKSLPMKLAKLRYRFRNLLSGAVLSPARLAYEVVLPGGRVERREIRRPALKMPRTEKRRLALSRN
jgi:hypothetical protein